MLKIENLTASYGNVQVLHDVSLEVAKGQIVSIIGSNGAGKTTLLKAISGLIKKTSGQITFLGETLPHVPHQVVERKIIHVPEGRKVFADLTISENLLMGGYLLTKQQIASNLDWVYSLFPILKERAYQFAGTLSGGEQQMLAIGRGLMSSPKILLLDEPSLGLAPLVVNTVFELISKIRECEVTILLVEQNAKKALALCDHGYVIENGRITLSGSGKELLTNSKIKSAYLGEVVTAFNGLY